MPDTSVAERNAIMERFFPLKGPPSLAVSLLLLVLLPQLLALWGHAAGIISESTALVFRVFAGCMLFFTTALFLAGRLVSGGLEMGFSLRQLLSLGLALLLTILMLASAAVHGPHFMPWVRTFLEAAYIISLLFFVPLILAMPKEDTHVFATRLCQGFVILCCFLILAALIFRFLGMNFNARFGYPVAPGIFAYFLLLGWAACYLFLEKKILAFVFFLAVFASGSRSAFFLLSGAFLFFHLPRAGRFSRDWGMLVLALAASFFLIYLFCPELFRPYLVERADFLSGRGGLWTQALGGIADGGVSFGRGHDAGLYAADGRLTGAHNAFLALGQVYGVPAAVLAVVAWFVRFMPPRPRLDSFWQAGADARLFRLQWVFFAVITLKSLVSDIFWTNMADAATLFACFILLLSLPGKNGHDSSR